MFGEWDYEQGAPLKCFSNKNSADNWLSTLEKYDKKISLEEDNKKRVKLYEEHPAGICYTYDSYNIYELDLDYI